MTEKYQSGVKRNLFGMFSQQTLQSFSLPSSCHTPAVEIPPNLIFNNVPEKIRASDWLKRAFSCNTSAQL